MSNLKYQVRACYSWINPIEDNLSPREFEAMILYANGCTANQIADILHKSPRTVQGYLREVWDKTGCQSRMELFKYVRHNGWLGLEHFHLQAYQAKQWERATGTQKGP